jgi:para-nitrobenzyl esterase
MKKILLIPALSILLTLCLLAFRTPADDVVKVDGGLISGTTSTDGAIRIFKGIPFAAPPVGELRWKQPQPVVPWQGVRKCEAFGASPMQRSPSPFGPWSEEFLIPKEPISEDCLTLNVWTGAKSSGEKLPVIVWIYGGGFNSGGTGCAIYDGTAMARKGVVFVSVNYRVGIFGFFAHPELTKESSKNASGNYGLLDQVAGLQWVKKNISAFGGDPGNVTIAGQSAGSMSVNALVASPLCKGLIDRAIAESGAGFLAGTPGVVRLKQAEEEGVKTAAAANATTLKDLRSLSADELFKNARGSFRPIVDGYVLPQSISEIFAAGKQNDVPLLTGWNEDEGSFSGNPKTAEEYTAQIKQQFGRDAEKVLVHYPATSNEVAAASQANLSRDQTFGSQNYTWAVTQNEKGRSKVYVYRFVRKPPATGDYVKFGAFHTGEVPYAYDNLDFVKRCAWEPVDRTLATTMSAYWVNFAKSGNPNSKGMPSWPAYNSKENIVMVFGEKTEARVMADKAAIDCIVEIRKAVN